MATKKTTGKGQKPASKPAKKTSTKAAVKPAPKKTPTKAPVKAAAKPVKAVAKPASKPAKAAKPAKALSPVEDKPKKSAARAKKAKNDDADSGRKLALSIASAGLENKALNVEIIDVRGKVDYADYVIVMSGRGERQVAALAGHIERELSRSQGVRCSGVEGLPQGAWVLMDYGDVIVHIFHEDTRGYYDVEALWIDAARISAD